MSANDITITIWNANSLDRLTINTVTQSFTSSSLIFITETWLLPPLRLPTSWQQYHTYGLPVPNMRRGQIGISLLINPDFPYPITPMPSSSPYVLSCQVASTLIHCVYLPPTASLSDSYALSVLRDFPMHRLPHQTNTIICGDINARHNRLLGDTRTTVRGTMLYEWMIEYGLHCWNSVFAFGVHTHTKQRRKKLLASSGVGGSAADLHDPFLQVHSDITINLDHHPVSLFLCSLSSSYPCRSSASSLVSFQIR